MARWQSRASIAAVALTLHIGFGLMLIKALQTHRTEPSTTVFTSLWMYPTTQSTPGKITMRPKTNAYPGALGIVRPTEKPEGAQAPSLTRSEAAASALNAPIDWSRAARTAAEAVVNEPRRQKFGEVHSARLPTQRRVEPEHYAGESYRDLLGNTVVWLSDRCYVVSELSPPGIPDYLKNAVPTTERCIAKSNSNKSMTRFSEDEQHELP